MSGYIEVNYSDDLGHNYTMPRFIDLGEVGDYRREYVIRRMGITRGRQYEIRYSGDQRCDLIAVSVEAG